MEVKVPRRLSSIYLEGAVNEVRDELVEMQGRIGELGRVMAKFVTSSVYYVIPHAVQAISTHTNVSFGIHAQTSLVHPFGTR